MGEEIDRHGHDLVDDLVTDAVAEFAPIVLARHPVVQAGELPIATALVAVMQIATELGVIDVLIHFGGHFEQDEAGGVVAGSASSAVIGCTQGSSKAEVHGGANEPTQAAVDIALRRQRNGMRSKLIVRQPPARRLGKWGREGLSVMLIEALSMRDKDVEIEGRELLGGKR